MANSGSKETKNTISLDSEYYLIHIQELGGFFEQFYKKIEQYSHLTENSY